MQHPFVFFQAASHIDNKYTQKSSSNQYNIHKINKLSTSRSSLHLTTQPPLPYEVRTHEIVPNVVEHTLRYRLIQHTLQLVRPVPVSNSLVPQVIQQTLCAVFRHNRHNIRLLMQSHRRRHLRRPQRNYVNLPPVLITESPREIVHKDLRGRIHIMQWHGYLAQIGRKVPANEETLTMADRNPLSACRARKRGIKIRFIRVTEKQFRLTKLVICCSLRFWQWSSTSTPTLLTTIDMSNPSSSLIFSSRKPGRWEFAQSATSTFTSMSEKVRRNSTRTMSSLNSVRADRMMLKPCLAKLKAMALPIPSDEPVTRAQLFSPQRRLKLRRRRRITLYRLLNSESKFFATSTSPITCKVLAVLGQSIDSRFSAMPSFLIIAMIRYDLYAQSYIKVCSHLFHSELFMSFNNPFFFQGLPPLPPYPAFNNLPPTLPPRNYGLNLSEFAQYPFEPPFPFNRPSPLFIHQQNNYFAPNYEPTPNITNPFFERLIQNNQATNKINTPTPERPLPLPHPHRQSKRPTTAIEIIQILSDEQPRPLLTQPKPKRLIQQEKPSEKKEYRLKNKKEMTRLEATAILPDMDNIQTKIVTRAAKKKIAKRIKAIRKLEVQIYNPDYQQPSEKDQKSDRPFRLDSEDSEEIQRREEKQYRQYRQRRRQRIRERYNHNHNINPITSLSKKKEEKPQKTPQPPAELQPDSLFSATPPAYLTNANYQFYLLKIRSSLLQRRNQ